MAFLELLVNKRFLFYIFVLVGSTIISTIFFTALYAGKDIGSHDLLFLIEEYGYILLGFTMTALAGVVFEIFTTPKLQNPQHYRNSIQQEEITRLGNLLSDLDLNETTFNVDRI